jgi:hypothetical protein
MGLPRFGSVLRIVGLACAWWFVRRLLAKASIRIFGRWRYILDHQDLYGKRRVQTETVNTMRKRQPPLGSTLIIH